MSESKPVPLGLHRNRIWIDRATEAFRGGDPSEICRVHQCNPAGLAAPLRSMCRSNAEETGGTGEAQTSTAPTEADLRISAAALLSEAWDGTDWIDDWLRTTQPSMQLPPNEPAKRSQPQSTTSNGETGPTLWDLSGAVCVFALPLGLLFAGAGLF